MLAQTVEQNNKGGPQKLHIRTISAILVWTVAAMLIANIYLGSQMLFLASIILVIIAVLIYFVPRIRKTKDSPSQQS